MSPSLTRGPSHAEKRQPFEGETDDLRVGRRLVAAADQFDARLQELAGLALAQPEDRTAIAIRAGARPALARDAGRQTGMVYSGRKHNSSPDASWVTNIRRLMSSPDRSTNTSAGCSTAGSMRA